MSARRWMVLNLRRNVWWRDNQAGYTDDIADAGRYQDGEALEICERMNDGGDDAVKLVPVWLDAPSTEEGHHHLNGGDL